MDLELYLQRKRSEVHEQHDCTQKYHILVLTTSQGFFTNYSKQFEEIPGDQYPITGSFKGDSFRRTSTREVKNDCTLDTS